MPPIRSLVKTCIMSGALCALVGGTLLAAEQRGAEPLPPPPELLDDLEFGYAPTYVQPEEDVARQALEPLQRVVPAAPAQPIAPTVVSATPYVSSPITISPPAIAMPADYFNLPLDDDSAIPGVVMPELDGTFFEPGIDPNVIAARPRNVGMSIRQLEPWFGLAKGSEGEALEAKNRNDEYVYLDQLQKSIRAYMDIVEMADAGNEAREEAWYGVARCEYRLGNWWKAYDALERSFPRTFEKSEVAGRIKLEIFIGERLWRMGDMPAPNAFVDGRQLNGFQAASRVYGSAAFNQPTADDAPLALLRQGDAAAMEQRWKEAAKFYRQVVQYFPESEPAMQARSSLTEAIYRDEHPVGFPEAAREDVASIMDDVERAPSLSDEAQERRLRAVTLANDLEAETKLRHAKEYLKSFRVRKSRDAAVFLLGDVVSRYPETPQAVEAAEMLRSMGIEPPMQLSDGKHFPLTAGWSGRDTSPEEEDGMPAGGSVVLEGQDDTWGGVLPSSPSRETVYDGYDGFSVPGTVDQPGW